MDLPPGFTLRRILKGHHKPIRTLTWSPNGTSLATASRDGTVRIWDVESGNSVPLIGMTANVTTLTWSSDGRLLALASVDGGIRIWDTQAPEKQKHLLLTLRSGFNIAEIKSLAWFHDGRTLASGQECVRIWDTKIQNREFRKVFDFDHDGLITALAWSPRKQPVLASGSSRGTISLTSISGRPEILLRAAAHRGEITSLAWSANGRLLASGGSDRTIRIWDTESGSTRRTLEGHTHSVLSVTFSADGNLLASKSLDDTVRLWKCDTWEQIALLSEPSSNFGSTTIAFHPTKSCLATMGDAGQEIRIWDIDAGPLLVVEPIAPTLQYCNAKVVLVGDSGVGKSGLALVLTGQSFAPTDSTHGRHVWTFDSSEVDIAMHRKETRETLLWDLAGQPGYRLIHQLHLNEVAVALVVFDSRSETDPFAGVRHWDRALRQARRVQTGDSIPLEKFLIAARTDRGGISVSSSRIQALVHDLGFTEYFETSAKELRSIPELAAFIRKAIPWAVMPKVSSNELFQHIKQFLLREKASERIVSTQEDLYFAFVATKQSESNSSKGLKAEFDTCIGRLESTGLIRRLSFGNLILLQPEVLDSYASAMVNAAKSEPDGLGSIVEEDARAGRFYIPRTERLPDKEQEKLILAATVEDLLRYEIALREPADDAPLLVFPSQFTRENPDLPDPEGKAVIITFEGPITNIYSTLAVRLSHSGMFKRKEMWKNAATYSALVGGTCGLFIREIDEGRAELSLFFDNQASDETRIQFEEYVRIHLERKALRESIQRRRIFQCENAKCRTPVTDLQASKRRDLGYDWITCNVCGEKVSLIERKVREKARTQERVFEMDRSADARRDFDASMTSAAAETSTSEFKNWAGASKTTLAVVFTDVVESTTIANDLGDEAMNDVRDAHFRQARELLKRFNGYEIKTIGDSFMVAFHTAVEALNFALALYANTGHALIKIRAGIHVGPVRILEEDAFGNVVNFAARVVSSAKGSEIWLSEDAKTHVDQEKARAHENLRWERHPDCKLKGFPNSYTLWSLA